MHLAIRADGGPDIGYGHLFRSGALAEECLASGHKVTVGTTTPQAVRDIFPDAVHVFSLPSRGDPEPFVEWIETATPDAVFSDAYPVDTEYQRQVHDRILLAVLQDDARHQVCADLFVNGNLYAGALDYEFINSYPRTYLGTDYVLLRSAIRSRTVNEPPWREDPQRAIVTMGGSDIADRTPMAVLAFDGFDMTVDVIIGPGFSNAQERQVRDAAQDVTVETNIIRDPDDLAERMFQADFGVITASSTTYELLALGTPILTIPVVDNQDLIATALRERNLATVFDREDGRDAFHQGIKRIVRDVPLRRTRRNRGMNIVDGGGAERIKNVIADTLNS